MFSFFSISFLCHLSRLLLLHWAATAARIANAAPTYFGIWTSFHQIISCFAFCLCVRYFTFSKLIFKGLCKTFLHVAPGRLNKGRLLTIRTLSVFEPSLVCLEVTRWKLCISLMAWYYHFLTKGVALIKASRLILHFEAFASSLSSWPWARLVCRCQSSSSPRRGRSSSRRSCRPPSSGCPSALPGWSKPCWQLEVLF